MKKNRNSIYTVIKPIYLFCKIFGMFPYSLINSNNVKERNLQFKLILCLKLQKKDFIFIVLQVVFIVLTVLCFIVEVIPEMHKVMYITKENIVDSVSYFIQLTGFYVLIISDILVIYINKKNIENIFGNIYEMDYYLQELNFSVDHIKTLKFGQKLLIATSLSYLLITIPDYINNTITTFLQFNYFFAELSSVGLNCFFITLCFDTKQKFFLLKTAITHLPVKRKKDTELCAKNVNQILKIYGQLNKQCTLLNSAINIVLLANVFNAFLAFIVSTYYCLVNFIDLNMIEYGLENVFISCLLWDLYNMSVLLMVIYSFNGIVKQVFLCYFYLNLGRLTKTISYYFIYAVIFLQILI